ncbi:MAG: TIGR04282 family arsenosugar biosynthesis glycosyltransferase [Alphaproteobacteria bacterium]|nr:TIGR04282 family arsenosugar biosynthesis glycosyltransferase [Alphaproteobacteria bacterium]
MPEATRQGGCAIAVMAKAPRPGQVKTRLVPPLTADAAMALSASFLRDVTENIRLASQDAAISGYVAYAPAGAERLFDGLLAPGTGLILADATGDHPAGVRGFGRSLLNAATALFGRGHPAVCLLNADSPNLPTDLLRQAARALAADDDRVVLGPAEDGGYYLIGMKMPHAHLFEDIDWSTSRVAAQTGVRAAQLGLEMVELPAWYDVDEPSALRRLAADLTEAGRRAMESGRWRCYPAPATAACLARLGMLDPPPARKPALSTGTAPALPQRSP